MGCNPNECYGNCESCIDPFDLMKQRAEAAEAKLRTIGILCKDWLGADEYNMSGLAVERMHEILAILEKKE